MNIQEIRKLNSDQLESLFEVVPYGKYNPTNCINCNSECLTKTLIQLKTADYTGLYQVYCSSCENKTYKLT